MKQTGGRSFRELGCVKHPSPRRAPECNSFDARRHLAKWSWVLSGCPFVKVDPDVIARPTPHCWTDRKLCEIATEAWTPWTDGKPREIAWEELRWGARRKRGHCAWTDGKPWEIAWGELGRERDGSVDILDTSVPVTSPWRVSVIGCARAIATQRSGLPIRAASPELAHEKGAGSMPSARGLKKPTQRCACVHLTTRAGVYRKAGA